MQISIANFIFQRLAAQLSMDDQSPIRTFDCPNSENYSDLHIKALSLEIECTANAKCRYQLRLENGQQAQNQHIEKVGWMLVKIYVALHAGLRESFIDKTARKRLDALGASCWNGEDPIPPSVLKEKLAGVEALVTGWGNPLITEEMAEGAPLKIIIHTGGSVGSLVAPGIYGKGVKVISGNAYFAESVAEGVIACMLFALRKMGKASGCLGSGIWKAPDELETEGLLDQRVGLVSLGAISKKVLELGRAFRVRFSVFSTHRDEALAERMGFSYASLEEIFSQCKIVSIHTAARPETKGMITGELLRLLRPDSIFINTARASVVDEEALAACLKEGRFRAVLDVFGKEPLPIGDPLTGLENAMLFPHCAGPTFDRRGFITNKLLDDFESFLKGGPMENEISESEFSRMTVLG
ncbi:MAG: hydroxyacid dehydrogenase [Clostridiales bacterium]|jgi:phosphoglycerate dehydrogenase-like enzyme|nr:hydroxyacid dehydrogenase [Clostridiales bacterium]